MANRRKEDANADGHSKGKIRFRYMDTERTLDFTVENMPGHSVTEGLRSIANALAGRTIAGEQSRVLPPKPTGTEDDEHTVEGAVPPESSEAEETVEESGEGETSQGNGSEPRRRRAAPRAPKFLSDLNLTTATVQLEDFVREKNPDGDMEKYAVIAAWFKEYFSTEEINIDHIFTAYKKLGWQAQLPPDPSQTFRNLKNNKNWFDSGAKRGDYKINWNGIDAVNKMGAVKA